MFDRPGRVARADGAARRAPSPRYLNAQIAAGADAVQLFDSWVGCLSPDDYRAHVLPHMRALIRGAHAWRARDPLRHRHRRAARVPARRGRRRDRARLARRSRRGLGARSATTSPCRATSTRSSLLAPLPEIRRRAAAILGRAAGRPGHIFNLGPRHPARRRRSTHVRALVDAVHELSARAGARCAADAVLLIAFGGPTRPEEIRPFLDNVTRGRPHPARAPRGGRAPLRADRRPLAAERADLPPGGRRCATRSPPRPATAGLRRHAQLGSRTSPTTLAADGRRDGVRRAVGLILSPHATEASRERYVESVDAGRAALGAARAGDRLRRHWHAASAASSTRGGATASARRSATVPADGARASSSPRTASRWRWRRARRTSPSSRESAARGRRAPRLTALGARLPEPQRQPARPVARARRERRAPRASPADGARDVVVAPIGFVCDHVEVLYDLDVEARATATAPRARLRARAAR